jgi:hypothetical protein
LFDKDANQIFFCLVNTFFLSTSATKEKKQKKVAWLLLVFTLTIPKDIFI